MFPVSKQIGRASMIVTAFATVAALTFSGGQAALAQAPAGFRRSIGAQAVNACYTSNFGDIAAKALGITAVDIRKAIVGGKTLQQIATDNKVDYQTVSDAITTARNTEIDQAVKDGVITQDEATAIEAPPAAPQGSTAPESTPDASAPEATQNPAPNPQRPPNGQGNAPFPDISTFNRLLQQGSGTTPANGNGLRGGGNTTMFNLVQPYAVVAKAVSMNCADLVKDIITPPGKSARTVATDQKVDPQAVTDALVKAYTDALAQDVTDGVITQAQSDTLTPMIQPAVDTFVGNPLPMGPQVTATPAS